MTAGPASTPAAAAILLIRDMRTESRWPDYTPQTVRTGILSSLSVPLPIQEDLIGALNVYASTRDAFDQDDARAGEAFAAYAAVAVRNADTFASTAETAENLRVAMASRATIEQAKGILMARGGISAEKAFDMLVRASQRENRKLRDVAKELVERVQHREPGTGSARRTAGTIELDRLGTEHGG